MSLIDIAWSPDQFARLAEIWKERLTEYLNAVQTNEARVLNWTEPAEAINAAAILMTDATSATVESRFDSLVKRILSSGQNLQHPRYIGHQVPANVPIAALFDAVGSVTNQVMAVYEMGPWATAVECALVNRLCEKIGWSPETASGILTSGGSLANLTALLTARNICLPSSWESGVPEHAALVAHPDAHYSISRSAGILGLGTQQVVRAATTDDRHLDAAQLNDQLTVLRSEGKAVVAVVACACATPTGAFDDLHAIADVCEQHSVWLHVDAAHGGSVLISQTHRHKLTGIERADSVVWDAHKMLFVPALCAAVLYRNHQHRFETFRQDAPYLFDPSNPGLAAYDSGVSTIECTKRALGFSLWGVWSLFGEELFEQIVDRTFERGQQLWRLLTDAEDFEPLHEPECNIVSFRHVPCRLKAATPATLNQFQLDLRRKVIRSGDFYIVQTTLDGQTALRACVMNPLTTKDDLEELLSAIRRHGETVAPK